MFAFAHIRKKMKTETADRTANINITLRRTVSGENAVVKK